MSNSNRNYTTAPKKKIQLYKIFIFRYKYLFISDFDEYLYPVNESEKIVDVLKSLDADYVCEFQFPLKWYIRDAWDTPWETFTENGYALPLLYSD